MFNQIIESYTFQRREVTANLPVKKKREREKNIQGNSWLPYYDYKWYRCESRDCSDEQTHIEHAPLLAQYLAVQEKVVWLDVSVDESKLVNGVYG